MLSWLPLAIVTAFVFVPPAQAPSEDVPCEQANSRTLANNVVVTVRPVAGADPSQACEVSIRDRNGKAVFSDRGFKTKILAVTGRDIDNDGQPDVVVGVDSRGTGDCCWEYPVISLFPTPRVLLRLPDATFDFQTKPGKTLIWTSASFKDLGPDVSVVTAHEFRASGFIDVTQDYCKRLLSGELVGPGNLKRALATLTRQAKQDSRTETGRLSDLEDTRLDATTVVLQQIYCEEFDDASRLVLEAWPATQQSRIRMQIRDAVAGRWPELARRLGAWN